VDDDRGVTLVGVSDLAKDLKREKPGKVGTAHAVGRLLAERARAQGITRVVFDRGGYPFHGRVQAVADGAREGGLEL
jgi:large subunit ribosomal protein L18